LVGGLSVGADCSTLIATPAMLIVAVRGLVPVWAGTVYVAVPDPLPDPVTVIHEAVVDDVQAHPACVVIVMVPVPPAADSVIRIGLAENVHDAPGSLTTKLRPAIVRVADRAVVPEFACAVNETVPEPVPLEPPEIVTHDAPLTAVQVHSGVVVTVTVPLPPVAGSDAPPGSIVNEQAAAACVTVNVLPPAVTVPVRDVVRVFAATLYATLPLPLPVAPAVMPIHVALLVAVHSHPIAAVTAIVPVPPPATALAVAGAIDGAQDAPDWVIVTVVPATVSVPIRSATPGFAATL
jgi:hypothetical protein